MRARVSAAALFVIATIGLQGQTYNSLFIPPTLTGTLFNLAAGQSTVQYWPGPVTTTWGYNGLNFWGPTLVMNQGDAIQINVANNLAETTTAHWHGFHLPAIMDGGPHQPISPGTVWSPYFTVLNSAATYWYHPHEHDITQEQLTLGLGGFIIVHDDQEASLALPRTYGVDDIPLALTSRRFLSNNQFAYDHELDNYGDYVLVNGTMNPQVTLPKQIVRLRILNAEVERGYNLGFSDNRTFYVIGNDQGLLNAPVPVTRMKLMVGERVEVLVDLTGDTVGASLDLKAYNSGQLFGFPGNEGNPVKPTGNSGPLNGSLLNNTDFNLLHIVVGPTVTPAAATVIAGAEGYSAAGGYTNSISSNNYLILYGTFDGSTDLVTVNGVNQSMVYDSATQINVLLGALSGTSAAIVVSNASGSSNTYQVALGAAPNATSSIRSRFTEASRKLRTAAVAGRPITAIPATLLNNTYWTPADVTNARTVNLTGGQGGSEFTLDNAPYTPAFINETVTLNAVEQWTISNGPIFGHSFHLHDVKFNIIGRSGGTAVSSNGQAALYESGWKDTVYVPLGEKVTVIAKFGDFASDTNPYMIHCHFLNHEDGGMMGNLVVVDPASPATVVANFTRMGANRNIVIPFEGTPGVSYRVQYSPDQSGGSWIDIATVTNNGKSSRYLETNEARLERPQGYYRLALPIEFPSLHHHSAAKH